jgi:hypothetical protein
LRRIVTKSREHGLSTSAKEVRFDDCTMWVGLSDGRTLGVPLVCFPRLLRATQGQRADCTIGRYGLHWESIDEDISIERLLASRGDMTNPSQTAT